MPVVAPAPSPDPAAAAGLRATLAAVVAIAAVALLVDAPAGVAGPAGALAGAAAGGLAAHGRLGPGLLVPLAAGALAGCAGAAPHAALAGLALLLALPGPRAGLPPRDDDLGRALCAARRGERRAHVLVAACPDAAAAARLAASLRRTDDVRLRGRVVEAVVDDHRLDRAALARRAAAVGGARCGFAAFPADAPTLDGLLALARAAVPAPTSATGPSPAAPAAAGPLLVRTPAAPPSPSPGLVAAGTTAVAATTVAAAVPPEDAAPPAAGAARIAVAPALAVPDAPLDPAGPA